jgi:Protein of unknown function (DUF3828)
MHSRLLLSMAFSAIAFTCAIPTQAQNNPSPKTFLESVYKLYDKGGKGADINGPKAGQFFHSSLITLVRQDQKAAGPDNVPVLDGDPVCSCQEWDGIWDLKIDLQAQTRDSAQAIVSFALFAPRGRASRDLRLLRITLQKEHGAWRIFDIVDNSDPKAPFALRDELKKDIASYAHPAKSKSAP